MQNAFADPLVRMRSEHTCGEYHGVCMRAFRNECRIGKTYRVTILPAGSAVPSRRILAVFMNAKNLRRVPVCACAHLSLRNGNNIMKKPNLATTRAPTLETRVERITKFCACREECRRRVFECGPLCQLITLKISKFRRSLCNARCALATVNLRPSSRQRLRL